MRNDRVFLGGANAAWGQAFSHSLHLPFVKYVQRVRSITGLFGTACGKGT